MSQERFSSIDDETLMAYVDGELPPSKQAEIEAAISQDTTLAARAKRFAETRQLAHDAFKGMIDAPVPDRLLNLLPVSEGRHVTDLQKHQQRKTKTHYVPATIAASLTLVVGILVGQQLPDTNNSHELVLADAGYILNNNPLYEALESTPSHSLYDNDTGDIIKPLMSFKAIDGRYCREFEINAERSVSIGIACRQSDAWQLEILLAADGRPQGNNHYQPATGYSQSALDSVLDNLLQGNAYGKNEEAKLIQHQWQP